MNNSELILRNADSNKTENNIWFTLSSENNNEIVKLRFPTDCLGNRFRYFSRKVPLKKYEKAQMAFVLETKYIEAARNREYTKSLLLNLISISHQHISGQEDLGWHNFNLDYYYPHKYHMIFFYVTIFWGCKNINMIYLKEIY